MKMILSSIILIGTLSSSSAQVLYRQADANIYIDTATGKTYPAVSSGVALDPNTGRIIVNGSNRGDNVSTTTARATAGDCQQLYNREVHLQAQAGRMHGSDPDYPTVIRYAEAYQRAYESLCRGR